MLLKILKHIGFVVLYGLSAIFLFNVALFSYGSWHDEWSGYNGSLYVSDGVCNIALVPIHGDIVQYGDVTGDTGFETVATNPDAVSLAMKRAEEDPNILGILLQVDSGGGAPGAGEAIAERVRESTLPVVAHIGDVGASAAYLIATGADTIIAREFADVGSIGVTMSYLDYTKQNEDSGIAYVPLSSSKFKDYGSPDKPLTDEERALFERDLAHYHTVFVNQVAKNRNLPVDKVSALADGSSMPAEMAQMEGLIDEVGGKSAVQTWFANELNIGVNEVVYCEY